MILTFNNKILSAGTKWLEQGSSPTPVVDEVQIGNQIWKAFNLAIDDGQGGIITETVNYGQGDVVEFYYNYDAAARVAASIPGWHLPTLDDWTTLDNAVGGRSTAGLNLKSTYGWSSGNGTDSFGFAAFPAGYFTMSNSQLKHDYLGSAAYFWSASKWSSSSNYNCYLTSSNQSNHGFSYKDDYLSVRLVKDA